jgi:ArsR family transcriptional regulator
MRKDYYRAHSEICKTIAHAKRLEILDTLRRGEMSVNQIAEAMDAPPANVSQQLAILRSAGVLDTRHKGTSVFYRIANPKILQAYDLMTEVMKEVATTRARLARPPKSRSTATR